MFGSQKPDKQLLLFSENRRSRKSFIIKVVSVIAFILMLFIVIPLASAQPLHNSHHSQEPETLQPHEAKSGRLLLPTPQGSYQPALMINGRASFTVTGMLVNVELEQTFKNDTADWQEGVYVFPLPENSAVSHMAIQLQNRIIEAEIQEKQQARRTYQKAKASGKKAALVEQERPNLFTQSVANIAPGETLTVRLTYQQPVTYNLGEFSFRFPMTITPRYIPGSAQLDDEISVSSNGTNFWGWAKDTNQVTDASRISPWMLPEISAPQNSHQMHLEVFLNAGLPLADINSPYHPITTTRLSDTHHITLQQNTTPMNRDFELRWRALEQHAPEAAVFMERITAQGIQDDYATLMLIPPQQEQANRVLPRQVIFIIDTSGSMQGDSIVQAKQSLGYALQRLKPQDYFNIIEFNSNFSTLFLNPQAATPPNIESAERFVNQLYANGGTEMQPALNAALTTPVPEDLLSQIIFITDGSVGNETALFELIHEKLNSSRLFTVGIGSAPNSFFMRKAAQMGHGTFTFIGSTDEVSDKMSNLFRKLESPILSHIQIEWPANMQVESWPQILPDLYLGEPLLVHANFNSPLDNRDYTVRVHGRVAGNDWQRQIHFKREKQQGSLKGISKLWAREKIAALLDEKILGRPEQEVRQDVLSVALKHQLVSPYTSLVAVEKEISRPIDATLRQQAIPNLVAKGQVAQSQTVVKQKQLAYPKTATAAQLHLLITLACGVCLLLYGGLLYSRRSHHAVY